MAELEYHYEINQFLRYPSLIQEHIIGEGTGLFTLYDENRHLVLFSHRRILEKPPSGGVSVYSESIPLDPDMVSASSKLLSAAKWKGVAMVEFKRDIRDGQAKLMEINGRFWGSLQLAIASGVDFPLICLEYYLGIKPVNVKQGYTVGQRLKWFLGILDHLIIRLKNKNNTLLQPDSLSVLQVASILMKPAHKNVTSDVFDPNDYKPFLTELKEYTYSVFS
jgi:predicted ATP-grasp superfamily ATP-dependent carboligase